MTQARDRSRGERRFVHLGDRLLAIARVRSGDSTVDEVAAALGVAREEVCFWIETHAGERTMSFEELRAGSPETVRLSRRVQRLADLVAAAERDLRGLHQELLRGAVASNDPSAGMFEASKQFGGNPPPRRADVAPLQPQRARSRKFVDGDSSR